MFDDDLLVERLSSEAIVDPDTLSRARELALAQGTHILQTLFDLGAISSERRAEIAANILDLPHVTAPDVPELPVLPDLLPQSFLLRIGAVPLRADPQALHIALVDPFNRETLDTLRMATGLDVRPYVIGSDEVAKAQAARDLEAGSTPMQAPSAKHLDLSGNLEEAARQAPIVRQVKEIIDAAVRSRASDIHLEPFSDRLALRYRIDGVLAERSPPARDIAQALTSRLKIMAHLNIAERRLPQDGRFAHVCDGREVDVRMSTIPTLDGESVVLRLLDKDQAKLDFAELGMSPSTRAQIERLLLNPNGIVLLTGPTGSGKSTTLYAAMRHLNSSDRKILSIEDPVEYQLSGVNQIAVKDSIGLTFAKLLRGALRQDPDVILVGEMRDSETSEIATRAALTGHLVLSTVHTNTAAGALIRLRDMGLPDFLLSSTLRASIAQRLVRRVCVNCVSERDITQEERQMFATLAPHVPTPDHVPVCVGCTTCNGTGFRGRIALYEVFEVTQAVRTEILAHSDEATLAAAVGPNHLTLVADGLEKVMEGQTTPEEIIRLTGLGAFDG